MKKSDKTLRAYNQPDDYSLRGRNYLFVTGDGTPAVNAKELKDTYALAKLINPNKQARSATNRMYIVVAPGKYTFGTIKLALDAQFIDLVSLTGNCDVQIDGLSVTANSVFVKGVDCGTNAFNLLETTITEKCKGLNWESADVGITESRIAAIEQALAAIDQSKWEQSPGITTKTIKHGRLYNWYAVIDARNIAPAGWHVSTNADWDTLALFLGGNTIAGGKLKESGTTNWNDPNIGATNESLFSALPSGVKANQEGSFQLMGIFSAWWGSNYNSVSGYDRELSNSDTNLTTSNFTKDSGLSIRLVKDNGINEGNVIIDGDTYPAVTIGTQVWLKWNLSVTHYQNGDPILSDFSGMVGAVAAYNNDESNVYDVLTIEDSTHMQLKNNKRIYASMIDGL